MKSTRFAGELLEEISRFGACLDSYFLAPIPTTYGVTEKL